MGSFADAIMTGFICRLCSKQKPNVVHFYTNRGKELKLLSKLSLLPVNLEKYDSLPKTICESCIRKLDAQYELVVRIRKSEDAYRIHRNYHSFGPCPPECPLRRLADHHHRGTEPRNN